VSPMHVYVPCFSFLEQDNVPASSFMSSLARRQDTSRADGLSYSSWWSLTETRTQSHYAFHYRNDARRLPETLGVATLGRRHRVHGGHPLTQLLSKRSSSTKSHGPSCRPGPRRSPYMSRVVVGV
jgi:hypothetical protein